MITISDLLMIVNNLPNYNCDIKALIAFNTHTILYYTHLYLYLFVIITI